MAKTQVSGTLVSIGTTAANPSGDDYELVGEVANIEGEVGRTYSEITADNVSDRETEVLKGQFRTGTITLTLHKDLSDDGQTALKAASETDDLYNVRLELPDKATSGGHGTYIAVKARVMSFVRTFGGPTSIIGARCVLALKGDPTITAAT